MIMKAPRPASAQENLLLWKRCEQLKADKDELVRALKKLNSAISDLITESDGVAGLHLNGDLADWPSLCGGGEYEQWLGDALDGADSALSRHKEG